MPRRKGTSKKVGSGKQEAKHQPVQACVSENVVFEFNEEHQKKKKVLAFHGPCLYDSKIKKTRVEDGKPQYLIHYVGWNVSYDEWIGEDKMLHVTDENRKYQAELKQQHATPKSKRPSKDKSSEQSSSKKRKTNSSNSSKKLSSGGVLPLLPPAIKKDLVEDYRKLNINKNVRHKLPSQVTVNGLLDKYKASSGDNSQHKEHIITGVREYFNSACPKTLLYSFEMDQYKTEVEQKDSAPQPSDVYGYFHLARLLCKLPYLVAETEFPSAQRKLITERLSYFYEWLAVTRASEAGTTFSEYIDIQTKKLVSFNARGNVKMK